MNILILVTLLCLSPDMVFIPEIQTRQVQTVSSPEEAAVIVWKNYGCRTVEESKDYHLYRLTLPAPGGDLSTAVVEELTIPTIRFE